MSESFEGEEGRKEFWMTGGPPMERRRGRKVFFWKSSPFLFATNTAAEIVFLFPSSACSCFYGAAGK